MSDDEFDSDSGDDFSASEDEWTPTKNKGVENSDDEDDASSGAADEDFVATPTTKKKRESSTVSSKKNLKVKRQQQKLKTPSLRAKMFKKYKPPPKTISINNKTARTSSISTSKSTDNNDSDSGSSVENFLVNPEKLDLQSSYFDVKTKTGEEEEEKNDPPNFDCNIGIATTNSENEDDDMESLKEDNNSEKNEKTCSDVSPFKKFYDYKNTVDQVKENVKSIKLKSANNDKKEDISSILALGETSTSLVKEDTATKSIVKKHKTKNSDSEWEEVEEDQIDENAKAKESIEITVALPEGYKRREKKITDEQAQLMRRLNRIIKENCLIFHKVSLLCHIAHGIYVNRALNNTTLMTAALKLLPSEKSYPDGRTCIKYFESIAKWYKAIMQLKSDSVYSDLKNKPRIPISLGLQIKTKSAICKQDYVFIFIVLLRAMGIQCRLVMNLVPLPIRPATDDLCSLKTKKPEEKQSSTKLSSNKSKNKSISNSKNKSSEKVEKTLESKSKCETQNITKKNVKSTKSSNSKSKVNNDSIQKKQSNINHKINESSSIPKIKVSKAVNANNKVIAEENVFSPIKTRTRQQKSKTENTSKNLNINEPSTSRNIQNLKKSRSPSPKFHISPHFIKSEKEKLLPLPSNEQNSRLTRSKKNNEKIKIKKRSPSPKIFISSAFCHKAIPLENDDQKRKEKLSLKEKLTIPQLDGANDLPKSKIKKSLKEKIYADNSDSDSDFEASPPKKPKIEPKSLSNIKKDRRVLSTDDENEILDQKKKNTMDIWVEVYSESEDQWITIDLFKTKVHCVDSIRKGATSPVSYVFAWNNDNSLKDVSPRYCPQWNTVTRKQRIDKEWLQIAIRKHLGVKNARDFAEDRELEKIHMDKPLPNTIHEFKNHPLYALERHLLKFEGIYPPNAPTLGFIRGEPIYPRDCIHTLHSRDIWLKAARVVKPGEKAYKIVKARPKWDRLTSSVITDQPLDIFGYWQTMEYEPPTAENGIVPRNAYGNVELFKPTMLPKKTAHIQLPGLNRVCKKLGIDCAQAVIGFDFHQGACHPLYDGFVVCEEFKDQVIQAWEDDQQEQARKELEKFETRVYGNWKRLIKGLLIRQRLKIKYNFGDISADKMPAAKRKK